MLFLKGLLDSLATSIYRSPRFEPPTLNPLPDVKILDWSKLKQIADDILKYFQNGK